jgi:hypothetical protein
MPQREGTVQLGHSAADTAPVVIRSNEGDIAWHDEWGYNSENPHLIVPFELTKLHATAQTLQIRNSLSCRAIRYLTNNQVQIILTNHDRVTACDDSR